MCPSMMCADVGNLKEEVKNLEKAGIDIFHLDVMDGVFVPNFGMGLQDIEFIVKTSNLPCDVHLMISQASDYVQKFADIGVNIIYVHPEADAHITKTLQMIRDAGVQTGIAVNPGTSFEMVKETLPLVDYVMIMSVNPGFAGQNYIEFVDKKIEKFVKVKIDYGFKLMVDGAISQAKIERLSKIGVDGFILGTSSLFNKDEDYATIIKRLKDKEESR